jgi:hypothetical protein
MGVCERPPPFPLGKFVGATHPPQSSGAAAPSTTPLPPRPESEALGVLLRDGAGAARHRKSHQTAGEALGDDFDLTVRGGGLQPLRVLGGQRPRPYRPSRPPPRRQNTPELRASYRSPRVLRSPLTQHSRLTAHAKVARARATATECHFQGTGNAVAKRSIDPPEAAAAQPRHFGRLVALPDLGAEGT